MVKYNRKRQIENREKKEYKKRKKEKNSKKRLCKKVADFEKKTSYLNIK